MPDKKPNHSRQSHGLLLTQDNKGPVTVKNLEAQEAFVKILKSTHSSNLNDEGMDGALDLVSKIPVYTEVDDYQWSEDDARLIKTVFSKTSADKIEIGEPSVIQAQSALNSSLDGLDLKKAFFRKAEGLRFEWNLENGQSSLNISLGSFRKSSSQPSKEIFNITEEVVPLFSLLSSWRTVKQLSSETGKSAQWCAYYLRELCLVGAIWFSEVEQERTLPGATSIALNSTAYCCLNPCCSITPLVSTVLDTSKHKVIPFMPRGADLANAEITGFAFTLNRRGHAVHDIRFKGDNKIGMAFRHLIPLLDGCYTASDILSKLPVNLYSCGKVLLAKFLHSGLIDQLDIPTQVWDSGFLDGSSATWLGHASVCLNFKKDRLLFDPLFFPNQHQASLNEDTPPKTSGLGEITAVFITHGDNDHLNPGSLSHISCHTPIIYPDCSDCGAWQVDMKGLLELMGFENLHPMKPWQEITFSEARVTAIPFKGEDWGLELATLTYLVEGPSQLNQGGVTRIYLGADSAGMSELGERIRGDGDIDLAFLGISGNTEAHVMTSGFGYGDFYQRWIPDERKSRFTVLTDGPKEAAKLADSMHTCRCFGYAASGVTYMKTAYSDEGSHEELALELEKNKSDCVAVKFYPGISISI